MSHIDIMHFIAEKYYIPIVREIVILIIVKKGNHKKGLWEGKPHTGNERYNTTVHSDQDNGVTYSRKYYETINYVHFYKIKKENRNQQSQAQIHETTYREKNREWMDI